MRFGFSADIFGRFLAQGTGANLGQPAVIEQYSKVSGVPMPSSPEEYAVYLVQEQKKWGAVVKAIGFKAE